MLKSMTKIHKLENWLVSLLERYIRNVGRVGYVVVASYWYQSEDYLFKKCIHANTYATRCWTTM